jgi:hypothetical protein
LNLDDWAPVGRPDGHGSVASSLHHDRSVHGRPDVGNGARSVCNRPELWVRMDRPRSCGAVFAGGDRRRSVAEVTRPWWPRSCA